MAASVVRLSRGRFDSASYVAVRTRLEESQHTLIPAIRALQGCLHYWAAIDPVGHTMVNVSVWASIEDARQMDILAPMQALAAEFTALGVTFERPIVNYETVWEIGVRHA